MNKATLNLPPIDINLEEINETIKKQMTMTARNYAMSLFSERLTINGKIHREAGIGRLYIEETLNKSLSKIIEAQDFQDKIARMFDEELEKAIQKAAQHAANKIAFNINSKE